MTAQFMYRGRKYRVDGWLWADDGASNGMIISRCDDLPIRGARMHPSMIQTGLSKALEAAAVKALEEAFLEYEGIGVE